MTNPNQPAPATVQAAGEKAERCEVCNSELSQCGTPGVDGEPSMDCLVCRLRSQLAAATGQPEGGENGDDFGQFPCSICYQMFLPCHLADNTCAKCLKDLHQSQLADANEYALNLCKSMAAKWPDSHPEWKPLPTLLGALTQIDNMASVIPELRQKLAEAEKEIKELKKRRFVPQTLK